MAGGKVMTAEQSGLAIGWRVYGLGVMALAMVCLVWGDFDPGQPMPKGFPDRTALAYAAAAFMLVAGAAVEWRRTAAFYAATARIDTILAARLTRLGQLAFGVCALLFGGAHFFYMNLTIPLVPKWLPPTQAFWAYATGAGHIAAGVAILTGVQARLAAVLLTAMYASFTPLVHVPMLLADPSSHYIWSENALNIALTGAVWVVADSLARPTRKP